MQSGDMVFDDFRELHPRGGGRKRASVFVMYGYGFVHDLAEFVEDGSFIGSMTTAGNQARYQSNKALVLIRPGYDLGVTCIVVHGCTSLMALRTRAI